MENSQPQVINNAKKNRFEISIDEHVAELNYHRLPGVIVFTHTGVPSALEGRGIGSLLVKAGLDHARENKLKVQPLCWFVSGYIQRHAEYQDLVG